MWILDTGQVLLPTGGCAEKSLGSLFQRQNAKTLVLLLHVIGLQLVLHLGLVIGKYNIM